MYFGRTKIFIIIFLVVLSIYQTANLWFEGFSNHSFFYYFSNLSDFKSSQNQVIYNEKSLIINIGNDKFIQNFTDIAQSSYKQVFDEVISLAVNKGKFTQYDDFDINIILDNKCVIYQYSYSTYGTEISTIFNTSSKNLSKIESFDLVAIVPNLNKLDQVQVIFLDTVNLNQYEFTLNTSYGTKVYDLINKFSLNEDSYYISSIKSGFELFQKNQFILNWDNNFFQYKSVFADNPILTNGKKDTKTLENYINIFFQNPSIKWNTFTEDTVTYSDENTVVKYYDNGVLEYSNYKSGSSQSNKSIFELYILAINFLNTDINIKNEYYLKNYVEEQDKVTFYFDYKINNLPINLSEKEKQNFSMDSMIEVTVSQNKISKYKRIIYDFYLEETNTFLYKDFLSAIDNVIYNEFINNNDYTIKNIELAYNFEDLNQNNNKIYAGWFIEINNKIFFED